VDRVAVQLELHRQYYIQVMVVAGEEKGKRKGRGLGGQKGEWHRLLKS